MLTLRCKAISGQFCYTGTVNRDIQVLFGNRCICPVVRNPKTKGFFHNKNGQALITEANLQELRDLNLVQFNASGTGTEPFNPTTKEQLVKFLTSSSNASIPAVQLSAQLTALVLNLRHPELTFVLETDIVSCGGSIGNISIVDLIAAANAALAGTDTALQTALQECIDNVNNNLNFVGTSSADCKPVYP
jgi:hypothetical protein